jgi:hypothetical protein
MSEPLNKQRLPKKAVWALGAVLTLGLVLLAWISWVRASYPSDHEPMGAYVRIVEAVTRDRPEDFFAYIEDAAQHACFTIRDYRKTALERVRATFPEAERKEYERRYGELAAAAGGPEVFALYAREEGWLDLLERDLSRAASVEVQGERASVVTVRGTRYAFRKRSGGIWGMTAFSPKLTSEAERAARDLAMIEKAALDYERAR